MRLPIVFLALVSIFCSIPVVRGQNRTSAISGVVVDESGAVVEGALIQATEESTGASREVHTNSLGRYRIPLLDVGSYRVSAAKEGFQTGVLSGVVLQLGREAVVNPLLTVGESSQSIEVTGVVRHVEASASTLSDLIGGGAIQQLPLNGRGYTQLAMLVSGAPPARAQSSTVNTGYGVQLSLAGSRPFQNSFQLDGVTLDSYHGSSPGSINGVALGVEAIREFTVLTSTFSAEYGRSAGGVVSAVTRSGGNDFHGAGYFFHRNDNLDARNFFDLAEVPEFRRNQFGALLGGPVSRDQSFFFVNYEGLRQARSSTTIDTTLSADARRGLLSSGTTAVDPGVAPLLELYPLPNAEIFGDSGLFIYPNDTVSGEDFVTSRFDHHFSDLDRLFARYSRSGAERNNQTTFALADRRDVTRSHSAALEEIHIFSPRLLNTARLGYSRTYTVAGDTQTRLPATDDRALAFTPAAPALGVIEVGGLSRFPGGSGALDRDRHAFQSFQVSNNLQWLAGAHSLRLGGRIERTHFNTDSSSNNYGQYDFQGIRDLITNRPQRFSAQLPGSDTVRGHRQWIAAWFVQESWRASRNLSIDLGLRHEWTTIPSEVNGKIANLDELSSAAVRVGGPLFDNPSLRNFSPRAGVAWDLLGNGRTVLRGGYGLYPDLLLSHFLLISGVRNPPFFLRGNVTSLPPQSFPSGGYAALTESPRVDFRVDRIPRDIAQPMVHQWNLTLERELPAQSSLRLSYVGSHGRNLSSVTGDANLAPPVILPDGRRFFPEDGKKPNSNFSWIRNRTFDAKSFYHGFQTQWLREMANGLHLRIGYGHSKSIDDSSLFFEANEAGNGVVLPVNDDIRYNRGLSGHDQRHHLVASGVWDLPSPRAQGARTLFGGWRLSTIVTYASGTPFPALIAYDAARTRAARPGVFLGQRPDLAPGASNNPVTGDPSGWFDPSAFLRPEPGFLGNLGRNTMVGPALANTDFSLSKTTKVSPLGEQAYLELRFEFFNAFNHVNFDLPEQRRQIVFTESSTPGDVGRITSARPSREIQLGVKLGF